MISKKLSLTCYKLHRQIEARRRQKLIRNANPKCPYDSTNMNYYERCTNCDARFIGSSGHWYRQVQKPIDETLGPMGRQL